MAIKKFDLVIFGATSFVGQILTEYLYEHIGLSRKIKWAIAGRSEAKLNELRDSLGEGAAKLPIMVADSHDRPALDSMCKKSRVIVSTVGPYILYGEELIAACAENGNDYCDLTGEAYWIKQMIVKYEKAAKSPVPALLTAVVLILYPQIWALISCSSRARKNTASTLIQ